MILQLVILLLPSMVISIPLDHEDEQMFIPMDVHHGRSRRRTLPGSRDVSPLAFLNSPFVRRGHADPERPLFQGVLGNVPKDPMDEEALRRKKVWENAITKTRPEQVLPIGHDSLKRSRCNALPFVQVKHLC